MSDSKTGIHLRNYVRYMVADYAPLGKPFTVTIKWVTEADWYNKKARQWAKCASLQFEETPAQLRLTSHENCRVLARLWGADADAWLGKRITIKTIESDFGDGEGSKKRTIRICGEPKAAAPRNGSVAPSTAAPRPALDQVWDLATLHEEPKEAIEQLLGDHGGDADAALAALKQKYAAKP